MVNNEAVVVQDLIKQLKLPAQDIAVLAFCRSNKITKVVAWVESLKLTQVAKTSGELYQALPQVSRLKCSSKIRFEILEALRPAVQRCIEGLAGEFLNQPLMLPETTQKTAVIAQAIQKQMLDGYTLCIKDWLGAKTIKQSHREKFKQALHRALTGISLICLRSYQLYTPIPSNIWLRANALYLVAHSHDLLSERTRDELQNSYVSIESIYCRTHIMGCSQLNQITPKEAQSCYLALIDWTQFVTLETFDPDKLHNTYVIDLLQDRAALKQSTLQHHSPQTMLHLNFDALIEHLKQTRNPAHQTLNSQKRVSGTAEIPSTLQTHLINNWSQTPTRQDKRTPAGHSVQVCLGLIQCHLKLCGDLDFSTFIGEKKLDKQFFDSGDYQTQGAGTVNHTDNICQAVVQNESRRGLCLKISAASKHKAEAGDIVSVRENGRRHWTVGLIRWIRKYKDYSRVGVKLLSSQPQPFGIAMFHEIGGYTDYTRAIVLPESRGENIPASIVTPSAPFKTQAKIRLKQDDIVYKGNLGHALTETAKATQFALDASKLEEVKPIH